MLERLPMSICHEQLEVRTKGKGLYEITDDVQAKIDRCGVRNGTLTVFVQHTSCSLLIMENADPTARRDLEEFFDRMVPEDADYFTHGSEGSDDMPSHIRMALTVRVRQYPWWMEKYSSARGRAFSCSNIAARHTGEKFPSRSSAKCSRFAAWRAVALAKAGAYSNIACGSQRRGYR